MLQVSRTDLFDVYLNERDTPALHSLCCGVRCGHAECYRSLRGRGHHQLERTRYFHAELDADNYANC